MNAARGVSFFVYHDPAPDVLAAHLRWLAPRYTLVPIAEACAALAEGRIADLGRRPAVVTIDDGRRGNRLLGDVFATFRVRPCLYLCTAVVGTRRAYWDDLVGVRAPARLEGLKRMTEARRRDLLARDLGVVYEAEQPAPGALSVEDLAALAPHVDFGSHGRFHQPLRFLSAAERTVEVRDSRREVEALTGRRCEHFALPSGAYDEDVLREVAAAGYRTCRTTQPYVNRRPADVAALGAFGISDDAGLATLSIQAAGLASLVRRRFRGRAATDSVFR